VIYVFKKTSANCILQTMRLLITTLFLATVHLSVHGQVAMTFEEAELKNISMTQLDGIYKSGIHSDPSLAVFDSNRPPKNHIRPIPLATACIQTVRCTLP